LACHPALAGNFKNANFYRTTVSKCRLTHIQMLWDMELGTGDMIFR
jgi:hypothetical protein